MRRAVVILCGLLGAGGMKRALALSVTLWVLLGAAIAQADNYGPGRPFGEAELAALAEAEAFWGRQPEFCTSRTTEVVAAGALGTDEEGHDVAGRATTPEGSSVPCGMWIEEDALEGLCSLVRHEYGHWLGLRHEDAELATMPPCLPPSPPSATSQVPKFRHMLRRQKARCRKLKASKAPQGQRATCWENYGYLREELRDVEESGSK